MTIDVRRENGWKWTKTTRARGDQARRSESPILRVSHEQNSVSWLKNKEGAISLAGSIELQV